MEIPSMRTTNPPPVPEPDRYSCRVAISGWRLHVGHRTLAEGRDHGDVMDLAADGSAEMLRNALWLTWIYRFLFERTCSYNEAVT